MAQTVHRTLSLVKSHAEEVRLLARARLRLSGLDDGDFQTLRFEALTAPEVLSLEVTFQDVPAMKIPYYSAAGSPLSAHPGWPQFYRLRYLETKNDFSKVTKAKPLRYTQPPRSGVCAYFPLNYHWYDLIDDPERPVLITEGELKAAKGCKEGFATIGLGGVYNFRSASLGVALTQELKQFPWAHRPVYIVYDSDITRNPGVCGALNALADTLYLEGAMCHMVKLPDLIDDGKTGLDDFLVAKSRADLGLLLNEAEPVTLAARLWQMNQEVVCTRRSHLFIDLRNEAGTKMNVTNFRDVAFANVHTPERVVRKDGSVSIQSVPAAPAWLKWPMRAEVEDVTYAPGRERFIEDKGVWWYNTWDGWGCIPKPGDPGPFLTLLQHVFAGAEMEALVWFLQWCAYPLQFPGSKLFTSVVIHGIKHGTGKSLIGYTLAKIYGRNFREISQTDLHSSFTEWAECKQFIMGDDVTGSDKRQDADLLKRLITQREMLINRKYIPSYTIPDCINYLFTSNHPDAFFLEDDDRRFFIHEVVTEPMDEGWYVDYDLWLNTGGAERVFTYLLSVNCDDFNPSGRAMYTQAKARMIASVKSDLGDWVSRLKLDPEGTLRLGAVRVRGDLFTNDELRMLYDPGDRTRVSANGMGRELGRAGFLQVHGGRPITSPNGLNRYYIVRNQAKWSKATLQQVTAYLAALHAKPRFERGVDEVRS